MLYSRSNNVKKKQNFKTNNREKEKKSLNWVLSCIYCVTDFFFVSFCFSFEHLFCFLHFFFQGFFYFVYFYSVYVVKCIKYDVHLVFSFTLTMFEKIHLIFIHLRKSNNKICEKISKEGGISDRK